jgi:hypothetical protein
MRKIDCDVALPSIEFGPWWHTMRSNYSTETETRQDSISCLFVLYQNSNTQKYQTCVVSLSWDNTHVLSLESETSILYCLRGLICKGWPTMSLTHTFIKLLNRVIHQRWCSEISFQPYRDSYKVLRIKTFLDKITWL